MVSDKELNQIIEKVKLGDERSFELLIDLFGNLIYHTILLILPDEEDAKDVYINSLQKLWDNIKTYNKEKGSFVSWFITIVKNECYNFYKAKKRYAKYVESNYNEIDIFSDSNQNRLHEYNDILAKILSPLQYKIIIDYTIYGLSFNEISILLNCSKSKVFYTYKKAINITKKYCKENGIWPE